MWYYWWGCRRSLNFITLGRERVNSTTHSFLYSDGQWSTYFSKPRGNKYYLTLDRIHISPIKSIALYLSIPAFHIRRERKSVTAGLQTVGLHVLDCVLSTLAGHPCDANLLSEIHLEPLLAVEGLCKPGAPDAGVWDLVESCGGNSVRRVQFRGSWHCVAGNSSVLHSKTIVARRWSRNLESWVKITQIHSVKNDSAFPEGMAYRLSLSLVGVWSSLLHVLVKLKAQFHLLARFWALTNHAYQLK